MKSSLLILMLTLFFITGKGQFYVNGENLNADSSVMFFEINYDPISTSSFTSEVDYGKEESRRNFITDSTGKKIRFHSGVDLLNFITKRGWKLADRQVLPKRYSHSAPIGNLSTDLNVKEIRMYLLFERIH